MLIAGLGMDSRKRKTVLASVICLVLIYYSAAWAVLRCSHDYDGPAGAVELPEPDRTPHSHMSLPGGKSPKIDCTDFEYHSEILAGPSAAPQIQRPISNSTLNAVVISAFGRASLRYGANFFANLVPGSNGSEPIHIPVYLHISTLRI